jgi:hypothetical protein
MQQHPSLFVVHSVVIKTKHPATATKVHALSGKTARHRAPVDQNMLAVCMTCDMTGNYAFDGTRGVMEAMQQAQPAT